MDIDKHELEKVKATLRSEIRAKLKNLPMEKRKLDSERLCAKLKEQSLFQGATAVLFFAPLPEEVDLWPLLEETIHGEKVPALPCFDADSQIYKSRRVKNLRVEIVSGQFGIREPAVGCIEIPLDDLDLVLVPGVAFDLRGRRLGRGRGFYDRLLENFRGKKIGIAFDEQITDEIPSEKTDVKMDFILTPSRCVATGG
jgi:5-formyltetrahydrofolate cyclo-ligase